MAALNYIYTVYSTRSTLTDIGQHRAGGGFSDIFPPSIIEGTAFFFKDTITDLLVIGKKKLGRFLYYL